MTLSRFHLSALVSLVLSALIPLGQVAEACSAAHFEAGGKNYSVKSFDWDWTHALAFVNPRQMRKTALIPGLTSGTMVWTSKYGSLTFNQLAPEFPYSGMNEKGVIVEILWDDQAASDDTGLARPTINESQWIQYILDLAASTEEAIELAQSVRFMSMVAKVHYLVCDASGACAVFGFSLGTPRIYSGASLPIRAIANTPYGLALDQLRIFRPWGGSLEVPQGTDESIDRMARLALRTATPAIPSGTDPAAWGFEALETVYNSRTAWNIVYEQTDQKVRFKRKGYPIRAFDLSAIDFTCKTGDRTGLVVDEGDAFGSITQSRVDEFVSRNTFIPANYRAALGSWYRSFHCI